MGLFDNIRGWFSGSKDTQAPQMRVNEEQEKARLSERIVDLVDKIKRKNSFDAEIWNLSNANVNMLKRKSLNELQMIESRLSRRIDQLNNEGQRRNSAAEDLEASRWTGVRPQHMNTQEFDRFQKDDGGYR